MKKFLLRGVAIFAILVTITTGTLRYLPNIKKQADEIIYVYPCNTVKTYRLGQLDNRFNITTTQANKDIEEAGSIWNNAYGEDLFKEDPRGTLEINFIFDERQQLKDQVDTKESSLNLIGQSLDAKIADYNNKLADFNKRAAQLNAEILSWNKKGGAPRDVYNNLVSQQKALQADANTLNREANLLNTQAAQYNKNVGQLNNAVASFNEILTQKPEQGLYDPNTQTISIYLADNQAELISVLAHEFGHALGMNHVEDKSSIMHTYANSNLKPSPQDTAELKLACQKENRFLTMFNVIKQEYNYIMQRLEYLRSSNSTTN